MKKRLLAAALLLAALSFGLGALTTDLTHLVIAQLHFRSQRAQTWRAMLGPLSPTADAYFQGMADAHALDHDLLVKAEIHGTVDYVP